MAISIPSPVRWAGWSPGIAYSALKNVAKNQAVAYQHDPKPEQIAVGSILPQL